MKISKSAKILSTALAIAMVLCSLPLTFGASADTGATVLDYSALENDGILHIADYSKLGMHDGNGLEIADGALITDGDWAYQIASVDKYTELGSAYAVYDVTASTDFTANFTETTNMNAMKLYVSENMLDWFVVDPTVDGTTATVALPYYANYAKITWPVGSGNGNGLTSVKLVKPEADSNLISVNYEDVKSDKHVNLDSTANVAILNKYGVYQADGGMTLLNNGVIQPDWSAICNKKTANSYNGYLTYKVQPNTYFGFSVITQKSNNNWEVNILLDGNAKRMGYENPLDFNYKIYLSKDNVNFVAIEEVIKDFEPVYSARYANFEGTREAVSGDNNAPRSTDYNFIVPEGYSFVKCQYPLTQSADSIVCADGENAAGVAGNDWFSVNKVEYTRFKYDYYKLGDGDYYIDSALSADNCAELGFASYGGGLTRDNGGMFDADWTYQYNNGLSDTHIVYNVEPGTAFYAGFMRNYDSNLNGYVKIKDFIIKLYGRKTKTSSWEEVTEVVVNAENLSSSYFSANILSEQNNYSQIKILWPSKADNTFVGATCVGLAEVAFTEKKGKIYDYSKCLTNADMVNYGIVSVSEGNPVIANNSGSGLQLDWGALQNHSTEGGAGEAYVTYKAEAGKTFKVNFTRNGYYNNSSIADLAARWNNPDYLIKAYTSATDTFEAKTEHPITYTSTDGLNFAIEFTVPQGEENIKITFPQNGRMSDNKNDNGDFTYVGNDYLYIKSVSITDTALVLNSAKADASKANTRYYKKDAINLNGLEIKLKYNTGEERTVDYGYTVQGYNAESLGQQTVTVSYGGCTSAVEVEVYAYKGDLNCDKKVDIVDFVRLKKIAVGAAVSDGASADINIDDYIDATDIALMMQYLTGNIESL